MLEADRVVAGLSQERQLLLELPRIDAPTARPLGAAGGDAVVHQQRQPLTANDLRLGLLDAYRLPARRIARSGLGGHLARLDILQRAATPSAPRWQQAAASAHTLPT